jgi:hypothetical protein
LPAGLFSNQKSQFGSILEALTLEKLGTFYDHFVYFMAVGNVYGHLVYFVVILHIIPRFGILDQEKSGNPARTASNSVAPKQNVPTGLF